MQHDTSFPDGPYVGVKWISLCSEGDALTLNQQMPYPLGLKACLAGWAFEELYEVQKRTRPN